MILDELRLDGHVAMLIGRSSSILTELAGAIAEAGASLTIASPEEHTLHAVTAQMHERGVKILPYSCNPASSSDVRCWLEETIATFGHVDVLVNQIPLLSVTPISRLSDGDWRHLLDCTLTSALLPSQIVGTHMALNGTGRIVNVIPGLIERGLSQAAGPCAMMGGIAQLSRALALEWADRNVRVNTIGTGWTEDMVDNESRHVIERYIPMGRLCRAEDISPLVLFLASSASSYMTGYTHYVDGGLMARG
jgi:NAD(P)-dependent dehydrogenase (short-subunit alcohol dehydrogenase family)